MRLFSGHSGHKSKSQAIKRMLVISYLKIPSRRWKQQEGKCKGKDYSTHWQGENCKD